MSARDSANRVPSSEDVRRGRGRAARPVPIVAWEMPDDPEGYLKKTQSTIICGGACVAFREKEKHRKDDYPGEYCVYLCRMGGGHAVLRWSDMRVNEHVRTVKEVPGRFP